MLAETFAGTIGGAQLSAVAAAAEGAGFGRVAGALPVLGSIVSGYYLYKDATEALDKYQACKAGIGG
jgi:outer membrane lipoprotein SlyB